MARNPECLEFVRRHARPPTPVILMGYYNPFLQFGLSDLAAQAADAGVDGFIVVDLPPEEGAGFVQVYNANGMAFSRWSPPRRPTSALSTSRRRRPSCTASVTGVTGSRGEAASDLDEFVARIRKQTDLPLAVGFGIGTPEQVKEVASPATGWSWVPPS